ncbi:universal stress protein [Pseudonocardia benzenivorans]|uniref:Universal stress protein n=1 Tax=Pseudonocardia benzenivorans TaxID=228005 RepID=A0ABW3VDL7_9PSEU
MVERGEQPVSEQRPRGVVVGVDGSEAAAGAVRWAAQEAARRHLPLRLVAAVDWAVPAGIGAVDLQPEIFRDAIEAAAQEWLAHARAVAEDVAPELGTETEVRGGVPAAVLHQESETAELLVVGNRGVGGFAGLFAGSVSIAAAASAHCPVVVVRGTPMPDGPVVVGVDGSPVSEPALSFAFTAASARGSGLVAVHAWSDSTLDAAGWALLEWDAIEAGERELLAERLAGWSEKYPDVVVTREVVRDNPAAALVSRSRRAQLVVVGSRGRGSVRGALLGSVSQVLLRHAGCPVAVVRA